MCALKNKYRKGANAERQAVNGHIKSGALFAGRFAGSKMKSSNGIKIDVIAVYPNGVIFLEQYKKTCAAMTKERDDFDRAFVPPVLVVKKQFIHLMKKKKGRKRK